MIKVKINKVVPYDESMKIKGEPMVIGDKKYVSSQTRI